jgi:hypothetical protein
MANSLYLVQMDIPAELEDDFNRIYNDQHIPAILSVPGVVSCKRYRLHKSDVEGVPRYLAVYEVTSPDIPGNPAWTKASDTGDWATVIRPHVTGRIRSAFTPV